MKAREKDKLKLKILTAVYNSKRYDDFGNKEVNEYILSKSILKIFTKWQKK